MKKFFLGVGALVLVAFAAIQLKTVPHDNPASDPKLALQPPAAVAGILRESCYDCHSNETRWPWYTYVAPVSWWTYDHVEEGREHLNFSLWAEMTPEQQADALEESAHEAEEGEMPLPSYLWIHHGAKLTEEQKTTLINWAESAADALFPPAPAPAQPAAPAATQ